MWEGLASLGSTLLDKLPLVDVLLARTKGRQDHDRNNFEALNSILSEWQLNEYCSDAINYELDLDKRYRDAIDSYLEWSRLAGNQFMINRLNRKRAAFDVALRHLRSYCAEHFFVEGAGKVRFLAFRPEQNPSRGHSSPENVAYFEKTGRELDDRARRCMLTYQDFRKQVKKLLYV